MLWRIDVGTKALARNAGCGLHFEYMPPRQKRSRADELRNVALSTAAYVRECDLAGGLGHRLFERPKGSFVLMVCKVISARHGTGILAI